jgi:hypothetical protein
MKTKLLIFSLSFFLIQGCSPSDDEFIPTLPPISQTGANTFGCFIDGKLLVPRDGSGSTLGSDRGMRFFAFPPDRLYNEIVVRDFSSDEAGRIVLHILDLENLSAGEYVVNDLQLIFFVEFLILPKVAIKTIALMKTLAIFQ